MKPPRKFLIGLGVFVIISIIVGQRALPTKATTEHTPPVEQHAKAAAVLKEFPSYQRMGRRWRSVGEPSVILTLLVIAVDTAQTPDRVCRYTSHSAALTSGCW